MSKIIITMPASILTNYPAASRQLMWQPGFSEVTGGRRYCFLQLGWSGGKGASFYKPAARNSAERLSIVR